MGFFDDHFDPQQYQPGRGLTGWLESLPQQQAYQPGAGFGGRPQTGGPASRGTPADGVQAQAIPETSVGLPYAAGSVPLPTPRLVDVPPQYISIGNYLMSQLGGVQASQDSPAQPDFGGRLGAGFRSWAYTPVGNPFAALANAITGFTTGQFSAAPALESPNSRLRWPRQLQEDDTVPPASPMGQAARPVSRAQSMAPMLMRRRPVSWR